MIEELLTSDVLEDVVLGFRMMGDNKQLSIDILKSLFPEDKDHWFIRNKSYGKEVMIIISDEVAYYLNIGSYIIAKHYSIVTDFDSLDRNHEAKIYNFK